VKLESILAAKGRQVITTGAETSIRDAIGLLARHNIGALVVIDSGNTPTGILSERDIIRHVAASDPIEGAVVGDWMTAPVTVAAPGDAIDAVLRNMTAGRFRHVPVVEGGRLIGIVSIGDLVKAERNDYRGVVETLESQLLDA
jgi:CBS domain-containing protein